ncbi:MAG: GHMP kinase [Candidatus Doudnabacteria bacterium]|nr:GHMP kinase [Candidatus Doudnabacteria bacterium]
MIISKTPLRISFVGGGSDLRSFYEQAEEGGAVVTTAINKHIYVSVNKKFDNSIRVSYSKTEEVEYAEDLEHPIVREVLKLLNLYGLEITSVADIPSRGTGLGSSSAFTVGLLRALHAYQRKFITAEELAEQAARIEIEILKEPIGKQDQYGTAIGGLKLLRFHRDGQVSVEPIFCLRETCHALEKNMMLLYTGLTRSAGAILSRQQANMAADQKKHELMKKMVQLAHDLHRELKQNRHETFGDILHANWMYKKELAEGITSPEIDLWYETARRHGATGGKLLGAGGGGFLLIYAPQEKHETIKRALPDLRRVDFQFENQGSQIIFIH